MNTNELEREDKNNNWFLRTSTGLAMFGGAYLALNKYKGPAKDTLYNIFKNKTNRIFQKETEKQEDIFWGNNSSIYLEDRTFEFDKEIFDDRFSPSRNAYKDTQEGKAIRSMKKTQISDLENKLFENINRDIYENSISSVRSVNGAGQYIIKDIDAKNVLNFAEMLIKQTDLDELLFEIRKNTLYDYLTKNTIINEGDYHLLGQLNNPKQDKDKLKLLIDQYVHEDPEFADLYKNTLAKYKSNYMKNNSKLFPKNVIDAKTKLLDTGLKIVNVEEAFNMRVTANRFTSKVVLHSRDVNNILTSNTKVTSSSLDSTSYIPNFRHYRTLGEFDYTSDIKRLLQLVDNLSMDESLGFKDLFWEITEEGKSPKRYYLRITGTHTSKKGDFKIEIPLAQHGRLPHSNPNGVQRSDILYPKQIVGNKNLSVTESYNNTTQIMLKKAYELLSSNKINDFDINPSKAFRDIQHVLNNSITAASRLESTARDAANVGIVQTIDHRLDNKIAIDNAMDSLRNFRSLIRDRNKGAIGIFIDLETLSPTPKSGPNVTAGDPHTQITQVGWSVAEISNKGKLTFNSMDSYYSDHGIKKIKEVGFVEGHVPWLKQYLPDDVKKQLKTNSPIEVGEAYAKHMSSLVKSQGRKFSNNQEIARTLIKNIIKVIDKNPDKPIYLETKFGKQFDLVLLSIYAPNEYAELIKKAKSLDIHGLPQLRKMMYGTGESLSQTKLLQEIMGNYGLKNLDFSNNNDVIRSMKFLEDKGNIVLSNNMRKKLYSSNTMMAHSADTDAMLGHLILGFEFNKYLANPEAEETGYEQFDQAVRNHRHFKTLKEQYNENKKIERFESGGMVYSSYGLSQGRMAKGMLSSLHTRHFLLVPSNPPTKQWNQMQGGMQVVLGNKFKKTLDTKTDLGYNKARRLLLPGVVSEGAMHMLGYSNINANAIQNLASNTVVAKYFATFTAFGNTEGGHHLSKEVLKRVNLKIMKEGVNLSEVSTSATDPNLNQKIYDLHKEITKRAYDLAAGTGNERTPTYKHYEAACQDILNKRGDLLRLPKNSHMLVSSGDKGVSTFNAPVDGKITTLTVDFDTGKMRVMADIEYLLNHNSDTSMIARGLSGKGIINFNNFLTQGLMYGGAEAYGPAQFSEKGYSGLLSTVALQKGFDQLLETMDDPNSSPEKKKATKKIIQRWANKLNMVYLGGGDKFRTKNMLVHRSYREQKFNKIKNGTDLNDAQKFMGNIEMNFNELRSFMIDSKMIWEDQALKDYYGHFGYKIGPGNTLSGSNLLHNMLKELFLKVDADFDKGGKIYETLTDYDNDDIKRVKNSTKDFLRDIIMPDLNTPQNERIKLIEAREYIKGSNIWDLGFLYKDSLAVRGVMDGNDARSTRVKIRRNALQTMQFNNIAPATKDMIRKSRAAHFSGKYQDAAKSRERFINTLLSNATLDSNITMDEINQILDIKSGLDIKKLGKTGLDDVKVQELLEKSINIINEESKHGENELALAHNIVQQLVDNKFTESLIDKNNKTFVSLQSAQIVSKIGESKLKKGGVLVLPKIEQLEDMLTFDLKQLYKLHTGKTPLEDIDKVISIFEEMKRSGSSWIGDIDKTSKTVKLNNLVMKAYTNPNNVINLISRKGESQAFGSKTEEVLDMYHTLESYKILDYNVKQKKSNIQEAKLVLQKQYLNYFLRGINSIEDDMSLVPGIAARVQDASEIYRKLHTIKSQGGWSKVKGFKGDVSLAEQWTERVIKDFSLNQVFVHEENYKTNFKTLETDYKSNREQLHYSKLKELFPETYNKIMFETSFTGSVVRFPQSPEGVDKFLESKYNAVPKEMAKWLGMDINTLAVLPQFQKLIGTDFDADQVHLMPHNLKTAQDLGKLSKQSDKAYLSQLDSIVGEEGKYKTLMEELNQTKHFMGVINGTHVRYATYTGGKGSWLDVKIEDVNPKELMETLKLDKFGRTITGIGINDPKIVTPSYIKSQIDTVATTKLSKENIGLFTNLLDKRVRQLMKMDIFKKNNASRTIIGNMFTGLPSAGQKIIDAGKHGFGEIEELSLAAQALQNFRNPTMEQKKALKKFTGTLFQTPAQADTAMDLLTNGIKQYYKRLGTKDKILFLADEYQEDIELNKKVSNLGLLSTRLGIDFENIPDTFGEELVKSNKFMKVNNFIKQNKKFGIAGAAIYLAANFFRPNQLSSSLNPLDAFTDLGTDIDGNHNRILSNLELDRSVPLDSINMSFSKAAYIRLNKIKEATVNKTKSSVINKMLSDMNIEQNPFLINWNDKRNITYTNNESKYIGSLGSSQLDRKYKHARY